jgi:hypothetical protein
MPPYYVHRKNSGFITLIVNVQYIVHAYCINVQGG